MRYPVTPAPRITPHDGPYGPEVTQAFARIMPEGMPPLALFRTLAVNERVLLRVFGGGLLDRGSIGLRDRELVIHRTCARLGSEYEWGVHAALFARKAGFGEGDVRATVAEHPEGTHLEERERSLLQLVDELVGTATVSDELWRALVREWTPGQLVEFVALVGYYHLISFTTNAFRIPLEPFAARFPGK